MLTQEQLDLIEKYVPEECVSKEVLIGYLMMHDTVESDIFPKCVNEEFIIPNSLWSGDKRFFKPISRDQFIRRLPIYFHNMKYRGRALSLFNWFETLQDYMDNDEYGLLETMMSALEIAFYDAKVDLDEVFSYIYKQLYYEGDDNNYGYWIAVTDCGDWIVQWIEYFLYNYFNNKGDYFPDTFITAYNNMLVGKGADPIIYRAKESSSGRLFSRCKDTIEICGRFPTDNDGNIIWEWVGIKVSNPKQVTCTCRKSIDGRIEIKLNPDTVIYILTDTEYLSIYSDVVKADSIPLANDVLDVCDDEFDVWIQAYAGPLKMSFNYAELKARRHFMGYTQQQVADAIGASVRTYQKWENGDTEPDCHYTLRLINWLAIEDPLLLVDYLK